MTQDFEPQKAIIELAAAAAKGMYAAVLKYVAEDDIVGPELIAVQLAAASRVLRAVINTAMLTRAAEARAAVWEATVDEACAMLRRRDNYTCFDD